MSDDRDARLGTTLGGYRIQSLIGRGGMSVVYLAEDPHLERKVALKLIAPDLAQDTRFRERFVRESRLAASLEHPNIITVYEAKELNGLLYIAMRYIPGTDLKRLIGGRPLDPKRTIAVLAQAASALDAAHARGLVHRDVKPGNILVAPPEAPRGTEHVYLSDFGLTKRTTSDSGVTATGQFVGTLDYAAPEQFEGKALTAQTDVYSLGCVLYECLTGSVPFARDREAAVMYAHLMNEPPKASGANPVLPPAIDDVVAKAMAKSPDDRYRTCGALVDAARAALDLSVPGEVIAKPPPQTKRSKPSRRSLILAGGALVLGATALLVGLLTRGDGRPAAGSSPGPTSATSHAGALLRIDPATNQIAGPAITVGKDPRAVAVGEGSVWVANAGDNTVVRLDPATGRGQATIAVGRQPRGVALGGGVPGVWVITFNQVWEVDPLSNNVVRTSNLGEPTGAVATGEGAVWVTQFARILRVDPTTGLADEDFVHANLLLSGAPPSIAAGLGGVWEVNTVTASANKVPPYRIDPSTGSVMFVPVPFVSAGVAVGENEVWIIGIDGEVARIDPATSRVVKLIGTQNGATQVAAGLGGVWVLNPRVGTVTRIDPGTNAVVATIDVGKGATAIAAGEGSIWVTRAAG